MMKKNWEVKTLGEVLKLEYGKPLLDEKRNPNGKYPVYGANGEINRSNEFYYDKPSIIVGRKGSAGEINLTEPKFWPLDVSYFVTFDYRKDDLNFIYYLLSTLELPKLAKGVKPGINRNEVYAIEVRIPPLPEQQRLVTILDEVFAALATAKENAAKNLQNARELFESVLQGVFANRGVGWEERKLGEVCGFVRGPFGGSLKKEIFVTDGYAVYEQQHAIYNQFDEIRYFINESKFNEMQRFEINPENLIMSCSGTMGKVAIVPKGVKKGIINQALLLLKPNKHMLNTFIKYWMESENFQESLKAYSQGAAIQNVASVKILKEISIPYPPLPEQRAIVAKLDALSAETKKLEAIYQQKLANLEELKQSVLRKAFRGEI
jgi:type I restriction enzyme S subunit